MQRNDVRNTREPEFIAGAAVKMAGTRAKICEKKRVYGASQPRFSAAI